MNKIPSESRGGFALPMAILVLLVTAGMALTTLNQSSNERRLTDSGRAGGEAMRLAETAFAQFSTQRSAWGMAAPPTAAYDSVRVNSAVGYADVVLQRIRPEAGTVPALYVIRVRGVYTRGGWAGAPAAVRVVTRYGTWLRGSIDAPAAWSSLSGLTKSGGAGTLSGTDACGALSAVAGVAVPAAPGYSQSGGSSVPTGNPPIATIGATPAAAAASIDIDWAGIVAGTAITPTITIPSGSWPSFANASYWPVIYINNPGSTFSLPGDGRGILIVRGNMTISGNKNWDGIVLVGGALNSNGNNSVQGAVVSGLNVKLGESVGVSDVGNGTKTFRYNSCAIASALTEFSNMSIYNNTWFDGWALY